MRIALTYVAVIAFAGIGLVAFTEGAWKVGLATIMLACANALLLL
jgi:hypothetical protein